MIYFQNELTSIFVDFFFFRIDLTIWKQIVIRKILAMVFLLNKSDLVFYSLVSGIRSYFVLICERCPSL